MNIQSILLALWAGASGAVAPGGDPLPEQAKPEVMTEEEVKPFFATGPLARAKAAFDAGRFAEATAEFAKSTDKEARLMRALSLLSEERGAEAVPLLAGLETELPQIADRIALWRGRAHEQAGDNEEAAKDYGFVSVGSLVWAEAQLARALALEGIGQAEQALTAVEPLVNGSSSEPARAVNMPAALLLAGRIHAQRGGVASQRRARQAFVECWAGYPLSPQSSDCLERLSKLKPPSNAPPENNEAVRRAELLLDLNRNRMAIDELSTLVTGLPGPGRGEPLACRAHFALGKGYRKERQHTKAMEVLPPVVNRCRDATLRARALYLLGSSASIVSPNTAVGFYDKLVHDYPTHPFADDALFFKADLLVRASKIDEAKKVLSQLVKDYPEGDFKAEALFRSAWLSRAGGDTAGALAALSQIEREYQSSDAYEYARAAYWRARLLFDSAEPKAILEARSLWAALADRSSVDYYSLLSRSRLAELRDPKDPPQRAAVAEIDPTPSLSYEVGWLADDPHFRAGVLLLRLGLLKWSADELNAVARRSPAADSRDPIFLLAELLDRAADYRSAHYLIRTAGRSVLREQPEGSNRHLWRLAYPDAYRQEVKTSATLAGVPIELMQALVREESALDPAAVSSAGAIGLAQLMPATARAVARRSKWAKPSLADLTNPEICVRLGAAYLGELLRHYAGSAALALAAYNAGQGAVDRWLRAQGDLDLDEFVEEIPIQETRGYVKRVLRSYAAYQLLYGEPNGGPVLVEQRLPSPSASRATKAN